MVRREHVPQHHQHLRVTEKPCAHSCGGSDQVCQTDLLSDQPRMCSGAPPAVTARGKQFGSAVRRRRVARHQRHLRACRRKRNKMGRLDCKSDLVERAAGYTAAALVRVWEDDAVLMGKEAAALTAATHVHEAKLAGLGFRHGVTPETVVSSSTAQAELQQRHSARCKKLRFLVKVFCVWPRLCVETRRVIFNFKKTLTQRLRHMRKHWDGSARAALCW